MFGDSLAPARRGRPGDALARGSGDLRRRGGTGAPVERWRLIVSGRVQGVGYRQACCLRAQSLGLGGWVRNRPDGRVELEAEGCSQNLEQLRLWCESGPPGAHVSGVSESVIPPGGHDWFEVRR
ncbi:acylphosphatase [Synechococcus sp. BSF8S]|nr:acylphosphatase [Synechococcus sp. BSF8S]MBC1263148.1 acylphosphatase [Synechococcus sp. BSA11S]